jgi:hypothetical protein
MRPPDRVQAAGANAIETADLVLATLPQMPFVAVTAVKASTLSRVASSYLTTLRSLELRASRAKLALPFARTT